MFLHLPVSHSVHTGRGSLYVTFCLTETLLDSDTSWTATPPRQRPPWAETPPGQRPLGQRPPWTETPWTKTLPDRDPLGQRPPWTHPTGLHSCLAGKSSTWKRFTLLAMIANLALRALVSETNFLQGFTLSRAFSGRYFRNWKFNVENAAITTLLHRTKYYVAAFERNLLEHVWLQRSIYVHVERVATPWQ